KDILRCGLHLRAPGLRGGHPRGAGEPGDHEARGRACEKSAAIAGEHVRSSVKLGPTGGFCDERRPSSREGRRHQLCLCAPGSRRSTSAFISALSHSRAPTAIPVASPPGAIRKVAGSAVTRQLSEFLASGSRRIGNVSFKLRTYGSSRLRGDPRSTETATTTSPRSR